MKKTFQNSIIFLLSIIILAIGVGMTASYSQQEGFTSFPIVNQICNPIVRKVRNYTNNKIESFSNTSRVFFKRFGLM
jgi:uncharacterized protein (UPF0128 family)